MERELGILDIKIIVATHKKYWMPEEGVYVPLHVGRAGKSGLGYIGDNTGDNISGRNANYCELTGLYWAWKNMSCAYLGLCHYRRYFSDGSFHSTLAGKRKSILHRTDYEHLLAKYDVILPKKRNYYIETVRSQYAHAHNERDLKAVEMILAAKYPEYHEAFCRVMNRTSLHILNMFVMKKELFDEYCRWLFDILFELEKQIDITDYDKYEARVYGFLSERLFNVWLEYNQLRCVEMPVVFLEKQNWGKKVYKFLKRKFGNHGKGFV